MKRFVIFLLLLTSSILCYPQKQYSLKSSMVANRIYKIEIGTVNLVAFIGEDEWLLSDCGYKSTGKQLDSLLSTLSNKKVKYIINTHWHHDHCGGNFYLYRDATIISHDDTRDILTKNHASAFWEETYQAFPEYALPDITFRDKMTLYLDDEEIELLHFPGGHSNGDIIVHFKKAKVVHLGDLLFSFGFPAIDFEHGGHVKEFAVNLKRIAKMLPDDVTIIAGHGPDFTIKKLQDYSNMILETLGIIKKSMAKGLSLKEIQQKKVLKAYEQWGNGYFTCEDWIEIVYRSLELDPRNENAKKVLKELEEKR